MANPEYGISPEQFESPQVLEEVHDWFKMTVYTQLSDSAKEEWHSRWRSSQLPNLQGFLRAEDVLALAQDGKIDSAMGLASTKLAEVDERFVGDEARAAKYVYFKTRAIVEDYHAEQGDLSQRPRGDLERSYWHLAAALDLIRADLQYEHITDNALQISECFGAAGMAKLQRLAMLKAHGRDIEIWGVADFGAPPILALEQKILDRVHQ